MKKRSLSFVHRPTESMSDNALISVYPIGSRDVFCHYESPIIHMLDPMTLNTVERIDLNRKLGIFTYGAHPHYDDHGNALSLAMKVSKTGPKFAILKIPADSVRGGGGLRFDPGTTTTVATVDPVKSLYPGYMHSFSLTENFFVLIEHPLEISLPRVAAAAFNGSPTIGCLRWRGDKKQTAFHIVNRVLKHLQLLHKNSMNIQVIFV